MQFKLTVYICNNDRQQGTKPNISHPQNQKKKEKVGTKQKEQPHASNMLGAPPPLFNTTRQQTKQASQRPVTQETTKLPQAPSPMHAKGSESDPNSQSHLTLVRHQKHLTQQLSIDHDAIINVVPMYHKHQCP